jgi:4a-hydroxytetrahydrobiopterin dehydratase
MKWTSSGGKLIRKIECQDFNDALALVNKIALIAEELNHHPDLKIHGYKFLSIELYTHTTNSITEKDRVLAKKIDLILSKK